MNAERRLRRGARHRLPEQLFELRDQCVIAAGEPVSAMIEREKDDRKSDHVWITLQVGQLGRLQIALSTMSRQSHLAGFDPRVRVGILTSAWTELPPAGVHQADGLDYAALEKDQPIEFVVFDREPLEQLLVAKTRYAIFVEAWGEFYIRGHIGVHQVHSRRASLAVSRDIIGRDGAVRFYFKKPNESEMLLFKFEGQP